MRVLILSASVSLLWSVSLEAQTYEPSLIPPQINASPQTATPLQLGDDGTVKVDLGFDFTYWGQIFNSAWVSSNGFVSFQSSAHLCCNGLPIEQAQRNTIYGFWTDLVSNANPYYQRGEGSILFGWYGTTEYNTQNRMTFEIGLFDDNKIQFNFGNLSSLTSHNATIGITGPGADDNIQLFYGRDTQFLRNQSGILSWITPQAAVDCTVTPLDPSCPPQIASPIQIATIETIQDSYVADVEVEQAGEVAAVIDEPVQEIAIAEAAVEVVSITEQVADAVSAERLTPDQVNALAASSIEMPLPGTGVTIQFGAVQSSGSSATFGGAFETIQSSSSPSSVANTLEALNMASAPVPMATTQSEQAANSMGAGQADTMEAIAAVPGFAAYTQVALQDRSEFYAPRDIYRNRRLRDANFEMYRITNANTTKWQEMVDAQYR